MQIEFTTFLIVIAISLFSCKDVNKADEHMEITTVQQRTKDSTHQRPEPIIELDFIMGKFDPSTREDFVRIDMAFTDKPKIYLQKEVYTQFLKMHDAAIKEGIDLKILSATRPFNYQKGIWERKWKKLLDQGKKEEDKMALEILNYSAMPGTSRHHWGTDIDLNYLGNAWFKQGKGRAIYNWLQAHAKEYGFCQPYVEFGALRQFGYQEEKWHWSYMPLAKRYYGKARSDLKNDMIKGFSGADSAVKIQVVEKYVLGINRECS